MFMQSSNREKENISGEQASSETSVRELTFGDALREATDICLERDSNVFVMGLGVDDPGGIFGTTLNLHKKYGADRVFDAPVSENALTGVCVGAASLGLRPILTHQRLDFALLSLDQIINNAAKWYFMTAGQMSCPLTIRFVIGRGWGQGPQHAQSLQSLFSHIPGLKVVMPASAYDAKGLLIAAVEDNNPVLILEHRWLHKVSGPVPTGYYKEPLSKAKVVRVGRDVTIVATSYMVFESFRAAEELSKIGIEAEVIDLRTISPWDKEAVLASVTKTKGLVIADTDHLSFGVGAEVSAYVSENIFSELKAGPKRVGLPDLPTPTSAALVRHYYPRSNHVARRVLEVCRVGENESQRVIESLLEIENQTPADVPDLRFTGPF